MHPSAHLHLVLDYPSLLQLLHTTTFAVTVRAGPMITVEILGCFQRPEA